MYEMQQVKKEFHVHSLLDIYKIVYTRKPHPLLTRVYVCIAHCADLQPRSRTETASRQSLVITLFRPT